MGFFPETLKTRSPYIAPTLAYFYLSLRTSNVHDDWRHAIVTPVAKAPHTADPNLFRLIILTSCVCKALEAVLKEKMLAHFSKF